MLFCPTRKALELGTRVRVEIIVAGGPRITLRGEVVSRRRLGNGDLRPGVGVRVHPGSLRGLSFIHAWARRETEDRRRSHRLPIKLLVSYKIDGQRRLNFTEDLSEGGVYINTSQYYEEGAGIELRVTNTDGTEHVDLRGVVVHRSTAPGVGIRLDKQTDAQRERYLRFLDRLGRK